MEFKNKILTVRAKSNFGLMFEEGYDKERPVWSSISSKAKERLQPYFNEINKGDKVEKSSEIKEPKSNGLAHEKLETDFGIYQLAQTHTFKILGTAKYDSESYWKLFNSLVKKYHEEIAIIKKRIKEGK